MEVKRKISALYFALLVIFINATYYSSAYYRPVAFNYENSGNACFFQASEANNFFLLQKTASTDYQGWKIEVRIPGLYAQNKYLCEPLQLKVIRKIFVVDTFTYTPCKSIILYPYHEFS